MSNNIFIDLTEEIVNKGWSLDWEFNEGIDLYKYNDCGSYLDCRTINPDVATDVDGNGTWLYYLDNLENCINVEEDENGTFVIDSLFYDNVSILDIAQNGAVNMSLKSFNVPLPKLTNGAWMFAFTGLESFSGDLSSLKYGEGMFQYCFALQTFNGDLSSLEDAGNMFAFTALTSFSGDLSSLEHGYGMFYESLLESFSGDLSNLKRGGEMFYNNGLTSFSSNLSSLEHGDYMFYWNPLTSFSSDLSSLISGTYMFCDCSLDTTSVQNIANTINDLSDDNINVDYLGIIDIGIRNSTPNTEEETAFNTMTSKGWRVFVNGSDTTWSSTASTNLTEEEQSASIPFYAKPIQVTEERANYTSSDGKFYNIVGGQFIYGDDLSTYGMFTSFEHAEQEIMISLNLTKIEKTNKKYNLRNLLIKR